MVTSGSAERVISSPSRAVRASRYRSACGSRWTMMTRASRSTSHTSTIPARAYNGILMARSVASDEWATSMRGGRPQGRGDRACSRRIVGGRPPGPVVVRPQREPDGVLHRHDGPVTYASYEQTVEAVHGPGVRWSDRRHLDDLPIEQFDAVIFAKNPRLAHALVLFDREPPSDQIDLNLRLRAHGGHPNGSDGSLRQVCTTRTGGTAASVTSPSMRGETS